MTGCCDDFDTYKHGYQLIRAFSLLMTFSQMRLPCTKPEDAGKIAKITHLENDFKAKSGDDFIAHWSIHHPVNKDLPPRLYFLFLRK